jgi:hypothetical protein
MPYSGNRLPTLLAELGRDGLLWLGDFLAFCHQSCSLRCNSSADSLALSCLPW